jgi:hypothetical protein
MRTHTRRALADGLFTGLIGYATVVAVFAALNLLAGRSPFFTPALFGSALFYGLEDASDLRIMAGPVLAYNMVHVLGFLAIGMWSSWLVTQADRHPVFRYLVGFTLVFTAAHVYAALVLFAIPLVDGGDALGIGASSVAAATAMGWYLMRRHPALRWRLGAVPLGSE